ncbi:MAG: sulfurtransferase complex subunit TusD [Methylococcales bacterium]|nr:sulfurtransferase complex subunit TusD [Methylococcales bacterium]
MKFSIQVNTSPYESQISQIALQFVKAALEEGHEIIRVFFYHEGIFNAFKHATPLDDELNLTKEWSELAELYKLDLVVCIAAGQRRGLLSSYEAYRQNKTDDDLAKGFRISGLGQWVEATLIADRFIVFG